MSTLPESKSWDYKEAELLRREVSRHQAYMFWLGFLETGQKYFRREEPPLHLGECSIWPACLSSEGLFLLSVNTKSEERGRKNTLIIMAVNSGGSSIKYELFSIEEKRTIPIPGSVKRLYRLIPSGKGEKEGIKSRKEVPDLDHEKGLRLIIDILTQEGPLHSIRKLKQWE